LAGLMKNSLKSHLHPLFDDVLCTLQP
jgi:hypothetical protein